MDIAPEGSCIVWICADADFRTLKILKLPEAGKFSELNYVWTEKNPR